MLTKMNFLNKIKYDFITIGGATEDLFIYTNEGIVINNKKDLLRQKLLCFEYGAKVLVNQSENSFGGGAVNAAVALAKLGFKTATMVAVGDDSRSNEVVKNIKFNNVNTALIQKIKGQLTGYSAIIVSGDKEHVAFPVRGANHYLNINKKNSKEFSKTKWIYLTSLSGEWQNSLDIIFSQKNSAKIAWNPGHVQLSSGIKNIGKYLEQTSVLIVNLDEARELILSGNKKKIDPAILEKTNDVAIKLLDYGPEIVVVTDSINGAVAVDKNGAYKFKPKKILNALNSIGVGDAFGSTFIAGLVLFNDINKALKLAGANAARVVMSHGAQPGLMTKKQINDIKL